ncbi:MAG TPA: hypothetical protein VMI92_02830 [Steroidobacteraceae bacterium]|nr:hypothetical protein [Steroidobacteraceae bacterium]
MRHIKSIVFAAILAAAPLGSWAAVSVGVSINIAPPVLPVYEQPPLPGDGYIWMPGYWAWGDDGYFWVPGTWVLAPEPGFLWTPGYWGFVDGGYLWHEGYWGPHVGFYGGVNYGFGYGGVGYQGGYWNHGAFFYNRTVNNVGSVHVTNVYNKTVVNNINVTRVSYNGGGGTHARPTAVEESAAREHHLAPTSGQREQVRAAAGNRNLLAKVNNGAPPVAATPRPQAQIKAGPRAVPGAAPEPAVNRGPNAAAAAAARAPLRNDRPARDQQREAQAQRAQVREAQQARQVPQREARQAREQAQAQRREEPRAAPQRPQRPAQRPEAEKRRDDQR